MLKGSLKNFIKEKYLQQKPNQENQIIKHLQKNQNEKFRSLTLTNQSIKQLNGVKGLYIKEIFEFSDVFSFNASNAFEIYEADSSGKQLFPDAKPILYAVAKYQVICCGCKNGISVIAITTNDSNSPYILIKENKEYCGKNYADVSIVDQKNDVKIGRINQGQYDQFTVHSDYLNGLEIQKPRCSCDNSKTSYSVSDSDNNKGKLVIISNCCNYNNPISYECGFPPNYNENQNTLLLSTIIYIGYVNYQQKQDDGNNSSNS